MLPSAGHPPAALAAKARRGVDPIPVAIPIRRERNLLGKRQIVVRLQVQSGFLSRPEGARQLDCERGGHRFPSVSHGCNFPFGDFERHANLSAEWPECLGKIGTQSTRRGLWTRGTSYSAAVGLRIGTTWPDADATAQNFAHASASCRRFWSRSPRR
jgi:hypothetical protein